MLTKFKRNFAWVTFSTVGGFFIYLGVLDSIFEEVLDPRIWSEKHHPDSEPITYASLIVRVLGSAMISLGVSIFIFSVKSYWNREERTWIAL